MSDIEESEISESKYTMSYSELEKEYARLITSSDITPENERYAASVFYGYYKGWNINHIIRHYNVPEQIASEYWSMFGFTSKGGESVTRTRSKQDTIVGYLRQNIGQVVTPAQLSKEVSISLPTFYNFYNANRHFFKKVKRGQFEILNPEQERQKSE